MSSRSTMSGSGSPRRCSVKNSTLGGSARFEEEGYFEAIF